MREKVLTKIISLFLVVMMMITFVPSNNSVSAASSKKAKSVTVKKTITVKTTKKIKKIKVSSKGKVKVTFKKKAKKFKVKGVKKGKVTITVTFTNKKKAKYQITVKAAKTNKTNKTNQTNKTTDTASENRAKQVVSLVNKEREKVGRNKLVLDPKLQEAANKRAKELKTLFSHTRPDGTMCFTVLEEYNIDYMATGENIAMGQSTPEMVVNAWMNSQGHKENILSDKFTKIGVGSYEVNGKIYWVQLFIGD